MKQRQEKYNTSLSIITIILFLLVMLNNVLDTSWFNSLAYVLSFLILCALIFMSIKQKKKAQLIIFLLFFVVYIYYFLF